MQDFTEGSIAKHVINFSTPLMFGHLLLSVYGIINMIWVGRLMGHTAVAAISASVPIIMLMPTFLIGLAMATNVLIAQAFGRKDTALLKKILSNSFFASIIFCLAISAIALLFRHQLMEWVNVPDEIHDMALSYLTIMIATLVFQFFVNWMTAMLRGLGDAITVVKILIMLTVFNVTLVPLFIVGFGPVPPLGVSGAAIGTALAALLTGIIGYIYLLQHNPCVNMHGWDYRFDGDIIREVFIIGVPASLQMVVVSLAGIFILSLVNSFGTDVMAAFGIGMQVDMLATIPVMSIGIAATSIAGQNLGAKKIERVFETLRMAIFFALAISLICTLLLAIFSHQIGAIFLKESAQHANVLNFVGGYYKWMAYIFPCFAFIFVIQGVLRSAGDTVALMVLSLIALIVIRVPLAYLLAGPFDFKHEGIWMAMLFSSALAVGLNLLYYKGGRWKKKRILREKNRT